MKNRSWKKLYIYRYDLLAAGIITAIILYTLSVLFRPGQIVFSDLDYPFNTKWYMEEIAGLWNGRWNTTTALNIPRLIFVMPSYIIASIFQHHGPLMLKAYIMQIIFLSAFSMYLFSKRVIIVYFGKAFDLFTVVALVSGALLYSLNPWVILRIQHIHLLAGYSLLPAVLLMFFQLFDIKFIKVSQPNFTFSNHQVTTKVIVQAFFLAELITVGSAAIHYFFYSALILGSLMGLLILKYLVKYWKAYKMDLVKFFFKRILVVGVFFVLLSSYWLLIYLAGVIFGTGASQNNINVIDTYHMFSRHASFSQVVFMQGYWWPMFDVSTLPLTYYLGGSFILLVALVALVINYRAHIVTFMGIMLVGFLVLSTGTYYSVFQPIFMLMAGLPVFGNIFREPNKMIGLMALPLSFLLTFGLETILRKVTAFVNHRWIEAGFLILSCTLVFLFVTPMKNLYIDHLLRPVVEPADYKGLHEYFEDEEDAYVIYTPTADQMLRPGIHIAMPYWNAEGLTDDFKPTGNIHVYSTPVDTLFHHEGNSESITMYFDLIQYLLDEGRTDQISSLYRGLGATHAVYHTEYLDQLSRQVFNLAMMKKDTSLQSVYDNGLFDVFSIEDTDKRAVRSDSRIINTQPLYQMISQEVFDWFDPLSTPVEYSQLRGFDLSSLLENDIIAIDSIEDAVLGNLIEEYKIDLFNNVHTVNPYMGFAKTNVVQPSWNIVMRRVGNEHISFEGDYEVGIVYSFVQAALKEVGGNLDDKVGETVYNFNQLLATEQFFKPDNPDLFDIIATPYVGQADIPTMQGQVISGEHKNIWQVAKSPLLEVDEKMPYSFHLVMSGRGTNKLHVKVRFYDANQNEIGIQYVSAPDEYIDFDAVDFTGSVISPTGAVYMRVDLLTLQRPTQKTYWWIHDVEINRYPLAVGKNIINVNHPTEPGDYSMYVRVYQHPEAGELVVKIGDSIHLVSNVGPTGGFKWVKVDDISIHNDNVTVSIENTKGFNAINAIILVPKGIVEEEMVHYREVLSRHQLALVQEGELSGKFDGNIQTKKRSPELSYGAGISLPKGTITYDFEIFRSGNYYLNPKLWFPEDVQASGSYKLLHEGQIVKQGEITPSKVDCSIHPVEFTPLREGHYYSEIPYEISMENEYPNQALEWFLAEGKYSLQIMVDNHVTPLSTEVDLVYFDPSQIIVTDVVLDQLGADCSTCERIDESMMTFTHTNNQMDMTYQQTCSCDWYIATTEKLPVKAYEELWISYSAVSDNINRRHAKVVFLDQYDQVVGSKFIFEVEEWEKDQWHDYEQLVSVPQNAKKAMLQFWARGSKVSDGFLSVRNLLIHKYETFIIADYFSVTDVKSDDILHHSVASKTLIDGDTISIEFGDGALGYVNTKLSPTGAWTFGNNHSVILNASTIGVVTDVAQIFGQVRFSTLYWLLVTTHILTVAGVIIALVIKIVKGRLM